MTRLASLLEHPDRLLEALSVRAPELTLLPRAVAKIGGTAGAINLEATAALQKRVAGIMADEGAGALSKRDLKQSCQTFLHPPHAPVGTPSLAQALCDEVDRRQRRSTRLALLDAYLDGFDEQDEGVAWLAKRLTVTANAWPPPENDPWPSRIQSYDLLNPSAAPQRLATAILQSDRDIRVVLDEAGLNTEGRRLGGLGLAGFTAACQSVRKLEASAALSPQRRLVSWSGVSGPLLYPKAWPQFAGALFEPWRTNEPPREHKTLIIDRAVALAGDPRINRGRWRPVEEASGEAYAVILRWLTQASVRQFFDIVSETMTDRPDMWAERRKFWTKYLDAEMIDAAWVAFGSDGATSADRAAARSNDKSLSMFGRLRSGAGRSPQHAALIMKINRTTIAEWSHSGKFNVWGPNEKNHPHLFRHNTRRLPDYDPSELMNAPVSGPHQPGWQRKLAQIIHNQTGRRP